jgi:hypothetical protein
MTFAAIAIDLNDTRAVGNGGVVRTFIGSASVVNDDYLDTEPAAREGRVELGDGGVSARLRVVCRDDHRQIDVCRRLGGACSYLSVPLQVRSAG